MVNILITSKNMTKHDCWILFNFLVIALFQFPIASLYAQDSNDLPTHYREVIEIGKGSLTDVDWRPDGEAFATIGSQGIWIYTNQFDDISHIELSDHHNLEWNPNGTQIATTKLLQQSWDNKIYIWDVDSGISSSILEVPEDQGYVSQTAWSPDGNFIAGIGFQRVWLWDTFNGELTKTFLIEGSTFGLSWSPDGSLLAVISDTGVELWDVTNEQILTTIELSLVLKIAWSPNGSQIATVSGRPSDRTLVTANFLRIWDTNTGELILVIQSGSMGPIDWSPDGTMIATGSDYSTLPYPNSVAVWDVATGLKLTNLGGYTEDVFVVDWSPDGSQLLSASQDNTIRLWQVSELDDSYDFYRFPAWENELFNPGYMSSVSSIDWNPEGTQLVSVDGDNDIRIWDSDSGELVNMFAYSTANFQGIGTVDWSPNGRYIADGGADNLVRIWDTNQGVEFPLRHTLSGHDRSLYLGSNIGGIESVA